jgi:Arc/MetJ family transcription regulator
VVWVTHMKTTIDISDALFQQAKKLARKRNITFRELVESALRRTLVAETRAPERFRLETRTFQGKGLQPGLSWDDWNTIRGMIYEGRGG